MIAAAQFIERLRFVAIATEVYLQPGEYYRLWYGGEFGILRLADIRGSDDDLLTLTVIDEEGRVSKIVTTASQCSVQFEVFTPQEGEAVSPPREMIGFLQEPQPKQPES
jgi:hypothetical protein